MILVTGATGYIGGRLIPKLVARGERVRVLARDPRRLGPLASVAHEVVRGDVLQPDTLPAALEGVETAYYLIHSMTTAHGDFAAADRLAAQNFAAACGRAHVRRIVYLGGLGRDEGRLSTHLASRQEVGAVLRGGPTPVTELRAAIIIGAGSASFEIIRDLAAKLPFMITPRWVRSRCEPIAVTQVLDYLVGVLDEPRTVAQVLEIGGGEVLTYADLLRGCATALGRRVRMVPVPVLSPGLSAYWLNLVTAVPMSLARPLVEGLRNDAITTDHRIREWLPVRDVPYQEAVAAALAEDSSRGPVSRWTGADTSPAGELRPGGPPLLVDEREVSCAADADVLFDVVQRVGGETGWYYADALWRARGLVDRLLGGVGMRRGRPRGSATLTVGQPVDFWRVEELQQGRLLRLRAEMKLPGVARLEFRVRPAGTGAVLHQHASFQPRGVAGWLYWHGLKPAHLVIFRGMARALVRTAEREALRSTPVLV
jgi:uncharacterized protein YbjT (DUF2867 family)